MGVPKTPQNATALAATVVVTVIEHNPGLVVSKKPSDPYPVNFILASAIA